MTENCPFDNAPDRQELLEYLMWHQNGPQKREVALMNGRSLDAFGITQLRAETRQKAREAQRAASADSYSPWGQE